MTTEAAPLVMIDLFAGLGGASQAMKDRGWRVVSVEIDPRFAPTVVADLRAELPPLPMGPDLLWASPPCTEYTRHHLACWYPNEPAPDLTLWRAAETAIDVLRPRWWAIENVQGAVRYHGKPAYRFGSRLIWTNLLLLPRLPLVRGKTGITGNRKRSVWGQDPLAYWKRSKIPYPLSEAIAITVEGLARAERVPLGTTP